MFDYYDYYSLNVPFRYKNKPTTLHHKTCPVCDRKLVNVYYSNQLDKYICKKCMDRLLGEEGEINNENH